MAKRLYDGGWYTVDVAPPPHDGSVTGKGVQGILRVRKWHPGYWYYAVRLFLHVWHEHKDTPHG